MSTYKFKLTIEDLLQRLNDQGFLENMNRVKIYAFWFYTYKALPELREAHEKLVT